VSIVQSVQVEPLNDAIARLAGEAISSVRRAAAIDAFVTASAALRGDVVLTRDIVELEALHSHFAGVRVLAI
jgi:hypothetical protein